MSPNVTSCVIYKVLNLVKVEDIKPINHALQQVTHFDSFLLEFNVEFK